VEDNQRIWQTVRTRIDDDFEYWRSRIPSEGGTDKQQVFESPDISKGDKALLQGARLEEAQSYLAVRRTDLDTHIASFIKRSDEVASSRAQTDSSRVRGAADFGGKPSWPKQQLHRVSRHRPTVFFNYSRRDAEFVDRLAEALERAKIDLFIDQRAISVGEEWQRRIYDSIRRSDIMIFVMSPSEICQWEIEQSVQMDKRILPIVVTELAEETVPSEIRKIQWLFFTGPNARGRGFDESVAELTRAIRAEFEPPRLARRRVRVLGLATTWILVAIGSLVLYAYMQNYELVKQRAVSGRALLFLSQHAPADGDTLLCRLQTQRSLTQEENLALKSLVEKQNRQACPLGVSD
jgi:hypothetical protein